MKQTRILALLLSFAMMLLIFPTNIVFAEIDASIFAGGDGSSAATAYEISNLTQLKAFRDSVNDGNNYSGQYIKLTADIDLEGSEDNQWSMIGDEDEKEFKGIFDGNGKTISGLYLNLTSGRFNSYGFFGYIENATVENLTVSGAISTTDDRTVWMGFGGVIGYAGESTVSNCHSSVTINGGAKANYVGGVVGYASSCSISSCTNQGNVSSTATEKGVGGVVGLAFYTTVESCTNEGRISGKSCVGGVVGQCNASTVKNCANKDSVSGIGDAGENIGGIAGKVWRMESVVSSCYNESSVSGIKYIGGIAGYGEGGNINDTYNVGKVTGKEYVGGIAGYLPYSYLYYGAVIYYCCISCAYNIGDIVGDTNVGQIYGAIDTTSNKVKVTNTYVIDGTDNTGGEPKTAEQFANGEVAYLLQSVKSNDASQIWGQKIGTDTYPTFGSAKVYEDEYNTTKVYRNEIDGNKILLLGADKKSATVVLNEAGTFVIVFADNEDNRLANVKTLTVTVTKAQAARVTSDQDFTLGTGDKIMLWDDLVNLAPLCDAYEVK